MNPMNLCIVTNHKSYPSALVLKEVTGLSLKYPWEVTNQDNTVHWGCDVGTEGLVIANAPQSIRRATNKLACLHFLNNKEIDVLPFTASRARAYEWWAAGRTVYCRTLLSSCEGKGIVLANKARGVPICPARMYTRYCKPSFEVRVFTAYGVPSLVYRKRRMGPEKLESLGLAQADFWIRTWQNGWIYTSTEGVAHPWHQTVQNEAMRVRNALQLDFCAVDMNVVLTEGQVKTRVIEVNTAPGIENTATKNWFKQCFANYSDPELMMEI